MSQLEKLISAVRGCPLTGRSAALGSRAALALLGVAAAGYMAMWTPGISSTETLLANGSADERSIPYPGPSGASVQDTADYLRLLAASIQELGPIEPGIARGRSVRLRIELAATPPCPSVGSLSYGFLVDADRDRETGLTHPDLDFGPDARVTVICDAEAGRWRSPVGTASLAPASLDGPWRIEISTTVERLPSVDFHWVAYAAHDSLLLVLPAPSRPGTEGPPGYARWAIFELSKF